MKELDFTELSSAVKRKGYIRIENFLSEEDIEKILGEIPKINDYYTQNLVQERIFMKREESGNRQGDAVMVTDIDSELPHLKLKPEVKTIIQCLQTYNSFIGVLTKQEVSENTRSMLNIQQYYEKSLPVWSHFDGFFQKFEHGETDIYGETPMKIIEGLLPRYVMVLVLENENDGYGTYVTPHNSDERIIIENRPGDLILFDNIHVRHGVPSLEKPRRMIGFRNFDHLPFLFSKDEFVGSEFMDDNENPGYIKEISSEESVKTQKVWNEDYKNNLFYEYIDKKAAF